jgi:hypothetical protein
MKAVAILAVSLMLATLPLLARAQGDRDSQEVSSYRFTEAALAKYSQAIHGLGQLAKNLPGACSDDDDEDDSATSIAGFVKRLEATPGAKKAVEDAGLTTREYVVFTFALVASAGAVYALEHPGGQVPAGEKANAEFVRAHKAAFETLGAAMHTQCDEDAGDSGDRDDDK